MRSWHSDFEGPGALDIGYMLLRLTIPKSVIHITHKSRDATLSSTLKCTLPRTLSWTKSECVCVHVCLCVSVCVCVCLYVCVCAYEFVRFHPSHLPSWLVRGQKVERPAQQKVS